MDQEPEDKIIREYEFAFLVKEESEVPGVIAVLRESGADIHLEGPAQKISLAYEIKKQTSAVFGFVQFAMEPAAAKKLEATMNMRPEVLRFMLITPPTAKEKISSSAEAPQRPAGKPSEPKTAPALSNEALEKKIEEILQ